MFAEKYIRSLQASNLKNDEQHHHTDTLAAAGMADRAGGLAEPLGSLLARAKFAEPLQHKDLTQMGNRNLVTLLAAWERAVVRKGAERKWINVVHPWDINALHGICRKIARVSLAHWLAGGCSICKGTKVNVDRACTHCAGTGQEPISGHKLEVERTLDMVSELEGLCQAYCGRAGAKLR
jgi:hypothetical protein